MMRPCFTLTTVLLLSLTLISCGTGRQAADKKLAAACEASIKVLSDPSDQINIQKSAFKSEKTKDGAALRTVTLDAYFIHDHGVMVEKTYTCSYQEQWGLFGYLPEFYVLEKDGEKIGNVDGTLMGGTENLMKINDASRKMY